MAIDLDEAERIGKAATDGPWEFDISDFGVYSTSVPHKSGRYPIVDGAYEGQWYTSAGGDLEQKNAEFIAFARNHWQEMIDRIRHLEDQLSLARGHGRSGHSIPTE